MARVPAARGWLGFVDRKAMRKGSEAELDRLGVRTAPMTRPVEMLSGGQRQVVALARTAIVAVRSGGHRWALCTASTRRTIS